MASALNKIFWGTLLVFLDFNINHFDIFPDFLGYLFIYLGLAGLVSYSNHFSKAKLYVLLLAVVSVPLIYQFEETFVGQPQLTTTTFLLMGMFTVITLIHLGFVYHLMRGLLEITQEVSFQPLEKKTDHLLRFYIILTVSSQIIPLFIFILPEVALLPIILVLAIVSFIVEIMLLVLIRQFRSKSLEQDMN
ncbi:hypothetical protein [Sporosarcina psychrophila]|uniref:hypothetical protein n=1 Tax=Sporosarcina psychrophila TaxID=1476 RepID=UPI00078D2F13|nr:hypothetical protein [Sporosarcina psychrophila]AMQ07616.1 hypothetical protein AZE41_17680 [Sporosarcina psychrophila]